VAVETPARGGRNQETAVAALEAIAALGPAALASIGTDGIDGPTDAAGAIVDSTLWESLDARERAAASRALETHETYAFLDAHHSLVRTGPTGTNVGDLLVMVLS
jgi:glycerate 2-kinase